MRRIERTNQTNKKKMREEKNTKKIAKIDANNKQRTELNRVSNGNSMNAVLRAMNTIDLDFAFIFLFFRTEKSLCNVNMCNVYCVCMCI